MDRILVVISEDIKCNSIFIYSAISENLSVIIADSSFNIDTIVPFILLNDQVFFIGHGADETVEGNGFIKLGDYKLKVKELIEILIRPYNQISVLGVFSCGNCFNIDEIKNLVEYFITDTFASVPTFSELFLLGFFMEYYTNLSIPLAFKKGIIRVMEKAISDPSIRLFRGGIPICT